MINRTIAPKHIRTEQIDFLTPKSITLDNGIPVHIISGGNQEILKIDFIFDAGIIHQSKPLIAKATNSLIKDGSKKFSSFEIASGIDAYGAFIQTDCSFDKAQITIFTLSKYLKEVLEYVKDIILNPSFPKTEFDTYINNAFEKYKINNEKVAILAKRAFMGHLFQGHAYGNSANEQDFKTLELDDIKEFYSNYYSIDNCEILIAGAVKENHIEQLNSAFNEHITPKAKVNTPSSALTLSPKKIFIPKEGAMQSALKIGTLAPNRLHQDYFSLQILNTVLGGYFGSRLMKNIREDKGYTYGIGSGMVSLKESGYFIISTEVGAEVTNQALDEIYKEINLLQTELISSEELDLVKNYLLGNFLKSCDGCFKMAALFENAHQYGLDLSFYNNYLDTIKTIDSETLIEKAQQYLKIDELSEVVVGQKT